MSSTLKNHCPPIHCDSGIQLAVEMPREPSVMEEELFSPGVRPDDLPEVRPNGGSGDEEVPGRQ